MRLVAKHAAVGYLPPGRREGCRNCRSLTTRGEENGLGIEPRLGCQKHDLEVTAGAICDDFEARSRQLAAGPLLADIWRAVHGR